MVSVVSLAACSRSVDKSLDQAPVLTALAFVLCRLKGVFQSHHVEVNDPTSTPNVSNTILLKAMKGLAKRYQLMD
jgi:hypothetical protein